MGRSFSILFNKFILAATAYDKIENSINTAGLTSEEARISAKEAKDLTDGLGDKAGVSDQVARDMLSKKYFILLLIANY